MFSWKIFFNGLGVGLSLIVAIGMQNAFVLKQALLKKHLFLMAILCSVIDAILIFLGTNGISKFLFTHKLTELIFQITGIIFLFVYGTKAFLSAKKGQKMDLKDRKELTTKQVVTTLLVVTIFNPHTYLDHCVVMSSIAANFKENERLSFSLGAILASFIWFFSLCYGAGLISKYFQKEIAWKILDLLIGCTMYIIAISLLFSLS